MPVCPEWLSEAARAKWFELIPQLQAVSEGLLSSVDVHILARYCTLWVLWQKARGFIEKHGETVVDIRGHAKLRPEVSLLLRYARELLRIEAEFGMTPKDRARLTGRQKPEPKSGKARFFRLPIQGKPDL
jgi:P27 family predicted phage terminase small subunit